MITTNTQTECSYPMNAPRTAYRKKCRCERCVTWKREDSRKDYFKHHEARKARKLDYFYENQDKMLKDQKDYRESPEGRAKSTLRTNNHAASRHGYTPINATWQEVMELQQSTTTCQHCGCTPTDTLHTDHCHETGKLRGMLCNSCNVKDVLNG